MADQVVKLQDENKTLKEGLIQIARLRMEMSSRFQESALLAKVSQYVGNSFHSQENLSKFLGNFL